MTEMFSDGIAIRYVQSGRGESVLLLHGFSRNIELTWLGTGVLEALAQSYHVAALDLRGHGRSGKPRDLHAYGKAMCKDPLALMDHLGIERAHFVGYSLGARIALHVGAYHPQRVLTISLLGGGWARPDEQHYLWDAVADSLDQGDGIRPLIEAIISSARGEPGRPIQDDDSAELVKQLNEQALAANDPWALKATARAYRDLTLTPEAVRALRVPLLAVAGTNDLNLKEVESLQAVRPDMKTVWLEGADHITLLERPELVPALVAGFNSRP